MESQSINTRNKILECAKKEFLQKGFKNSSLRNISKEAGVTTGAVYGYFKDKDSLFVELVKDFMDGLKKLIYKIEGNEAKIGMEDLFFSRENRLEQVEIHKEYINYIYDNIDSAKLIIMHSDGSTAGNYMEELSNFLTQFDKERLKGLNYDNNILVDEFIIHMLVKFYISSVCELIEHGKKREEALQYVTTLSTFLFAGWAEILKSNKSL